MAKLNNYSSFLSEFYLFFALKGGALQISFFILLPTGRDWFFAKASSLRFLFSTTIRIETLQIEPMIRRDSPPFCNSLIEVKHFFGTKSH